MDVRRIREHYRQAGMVGRVGLSRSPAVIVVDFISGLTDPSYPLGAGMDTAVEATARLLEAARAGSVPIVFLTIGYQAYLRDAGVFILKAPGLRHQLLGASAIEVDRRLEPRRDETVLVKKLQSGFFGIPLASILTAADVDTCVIAGRVTSGCVRATAVDAMQHGFHTILAAECVADRAAGPPEANVGDIDSKIAALVTLDEALSYLAGVPQAQNADETQADVALLEPVA